jgi:hypothetical protein
MLTGFLRRRTAIGSAQPSQDTIEIQREVRVPRNDGAGDCFGPVMFLRGLRAPLIQNPGRRSPIEDHQEGGSMSSLDHRDSAEPSLFVCAPSPQIVHVGVNDDDSYGSSSKHTMRIRILGSPKSF